MKIEVMIYVYLAVCVGMIVFNIISAVLSKVRDKKILRVSRGFEKRISEEMRWIEESDNVHSEHKKYLTRKLKQIGNMRAFDAALEREYSENPELVKKYLHSIGSVFVSLTIGYSKREPIEMAYFPYIMKKYRILNGRPFDAVIGMLYRILQEPSIYCRENAMQAIYTIGDCGCVVKALTIIDGQNQFYHSKLITDGLLNFDGNTQKLHDALWNAFDEFSVQMQITLLNYFRFSSDACCDRMLELMIDESRDDEIRFACIRYFGKYRFEEAYKLLLKYADGMNGMRWEYSAIASAALSTYPTSEAKEILKANLSNRNWYIRFNSSQSLEKMGLTYFELIDVVEGNDRYAAETLRYRFDIRNIIEQEKEDKVVC